MSYRVALLSFALLVAACQPQSGQPTQPTGPARFEIRDFKLSETTTAYGSLSVAGRGTLIALDDSAKKGNYLVWFTAKRSRGEEETVSGSVILRDGLATVETNDFIAKDDKDKFKVRYSDWKMIGFIKLQEAVFIQEGAASAPQK